VKPLWLGIALYFVFLVAHAWAHPEDAPDCGPVCPAHLTVPTVTPTTTPTATPTPVTLLNFSGLETGDFDEGISTSGTVSVDTGTVKNGTYSLRSNPTTTAIGYYALGAYSAAGVAAISNHTTVCIRTWFRYATKPSAGTEPLLTWQAQFGEAASLRLKSDGAVAMYDPGAVAGTSSTIISADTWYLLLTQVDTASASASLKIYDSSLALLETVAGTGDFAIATPREVRFGKTTNVGGRTVDFYFDDMAFSVTGCPDINGVVRRAQVNGAGSSSSWTTGTGSTFAEVDEVPPDDDTTYLETAETATHYMAVADSSTIGMTGRISAVKTRGRCKEPSSVSSSLRVGIKSGATTSETTGSNRTTSYASLFKLFTTDPNTSAFWTLGNFDAIEAGIRENNLVSQRCTAVDLQVEGTP